jgi:hypothetical protein
MADIDVDQWRNAQALVLRSAKNCRRLVVLHDNGRVVKFRHSHGAPVHGRVATVADPQRLARELYEANAAAVDFVVVMERDSVDSYFAHIQNNWNIDDDLDEFVHKTYASLDEFDGIVTHPGPARRTLGLQWRIGASYEQVRSVLGTLVAPSSSAVLGVTRDGQLWASLILDFDGDAKIASITTADPSLVDSHGTHRELVDRLTAWVERSARTVSLAILLDHAAAQEFLAAPYDDKATTLTRLLADGQGSLGRSRSALVDRHGAP